MHSRTMCLNRLAMFALPALICVSVAAAQRPETPQRRGTTSGAASTPEIGDTQRTSPVQKLVVFKLQHGSAQTVVGLLEQVLPSLVESKELRLVADQSSNSIHALGTDGALEKVQAMIRNLETLEQEEREGSAPEVRIFSLKQVSAREAAEMLRSLYADRTAPPFGRQRGDGGRVAIAADERSNSVIVSGDKNILETIEALLIRLDQPQPREEERQTEVIRLDGVPSDEIVETIRRLGATRLEVNVVGDGTGNQIFLRGDKESVQQATELLQKVYGGRSRESDDVRLRVIWLVHGGLAGEDAADPPQNLEKVLNALKKSAGVGDLKMAAQFVLNASGVGGRQLRATGTTTIRSAGTTTVRSRSMRTDISLHATIVEASDRSPRLEINIDVTQSSETGSSAICGLNTVLSAPPGHPVVLGMTPIDSMNSVFVIELLPPDDPEAAVEPAATTPAAP